MTSPKRPAQAPPRSKRAALRLKSSSFSSMCPAQFHCEQPNLLGSFALGAGQLFQRKSEGQPGPDFIDGMAIGNRVAQADIEGEIVADLPYRSNKARNCV